MDKKTRVLCSLILGLTVVLYQSANGLGKCNDGDSKFHMENKIQHCSDNHWEDECTITWSTINAHTACSRLTESPTTVTNTITMTSFRDQYTKTVTTTATQTVSATSGCSTSSFIMSSQQLPTVNSMSRTTTPSSSLDLPRPSPTSQLRPTSHQLSAAVAATSAPVPSGSTAGTSQPGAVLQTSPSNIDHDQQDQKRTLMCNTASTVLAIVSGTLLLCLALSLIGWMWTCCALRRRRMRESHTSTKQKPLKRGNTASNGEHKFENPLYETNSLDSNVHTYSPESQAGYETVMFDDKNPAGAREQRFIVKTAVDGGPYYHVLEKPLPDHAIIDTSQQDREENGTDSASS